MAYIRYITKGKGQEYASLADSVRNGSQVSQQYLGNLGLVIDKKSGIFRNKERGVFRYTLEDGFCDLPDAFSEKQAQAKQERLILDFGDTFFLSQYFELQAFKDAFYQVLPVQTDTLLSLVFYRILTDKKAYCYADTWWHGNYASLLFPKAKLASQRVSEFLVDVGKEDVQRGFFREYYRLLYGGKDATGILIQYKSTAYGRATLRGSAVPASRRSV